MICYYNSVAIWLTKPACFGDQNGSSCFILLCFILLLPFWHVAAFFSISSISLSFFSSSPALYYVEPSWSKLLGSRFGKWTILGYDWFSFLQFLGMYSFSNKNMIYKSWMFGIIHLVLTICLQKSFEDAMESIETVKAQKDEQWLWYTNPNSKNNGTLFTLPNMIADDNG